MIKKFLIEHFNNLWIEYKIIKSKNTLIDIKREDKKVFVFLASDYSNIGDVAITYAQKKFLQDTFEDYKIIEIPANQTLDYVKPVRNIITKNDIITTIGGGNMGDIYEYYESLRRLVIKKFKDNFIISFPQTIDFSETKKGKKSLKKTKKIMKNHRKIIILARENKSYKKMQQYFGEDKVVLVPDIVLYLKNKIKINNSKEDKIGICFRDDKEINFEYTDVINRIKQETNIHNKIEFDTYVNEDEFEYDKRYDIFYELLKNISTCKTIYTNRLHAMIFAYLTNTKCFFVDNSNKKISETYKQWLNKSPYIIEATNENISMKSYNEMLDEDTSDQIISDKFEGLKRILVGLHKKYSI